MRNSKQCLSLFTAIAIALSVATWPQPASASLPAGEAISVSCCPVRTAPPVTRISLNTGTAPWQVSGKYLRGGYALVGGVFAPVPPSPYSVPAQVTIPDVAWTAALAPANWVQPFSGGTPESVSGSYIDGNGRHHSVVYNYTLIVRVDKMCKKIRSATFSGRFASDNQSQAFLDLTGSPVSPNPITTPAGVGPADFQPSGERDFRSVVTSRGVYVLRVPVTNNGGVTGLMLRGEVSLDCGSTAT